LPKSKVSPAGLPAISIIALNVSAASLSKTPCTLASCVISMCSAVVLPISNAAESRRAVICVPAARAPKAHATQSRMYANFLIIEVKSSVSLDIF